MPRLKRRGLPRRGSYDTSSRVRHALISGHDFEFSDPSLGDVLDPDELRRVWESQRAEIIAEHVEECRRSLDFAQQSLANTQCHGGPSREGAALERRIAELESQIANPTPYAMKWLELGTEDGPPFSPKRFLRQLSEANSGGAA